MQSFVHLHTHTEYSMLDGAARINDLLDKVSQDHQPAIAITDHGNMYGVLDFYKGARARGINPIIGIEAYMAAQSRRDRPTRRGRIDDTGGDGDSGEKLYYHLILLAENNVGYNNLIQLSSRAFLEGYYYKPRVDWELLAQHHEGLIATTGCLGGLVLQQLLRGDTEQATKIAGRLQDIFGKDSLFVELQDHGLAEQRRTNPLLVDLARRIGAPLVATNDSHYVNREDHMAHDALLCIQTGATLNDEKRFKFEGSEHYVKSAAEMRELFREIPEACDNTELIAQRCNVTIEFGSPQLPEIPIPAEFQADNYNQSATIYLRHLTEAGAVERYGSEPDDRTRARIDYELAVIAEMGFSGYFLVVWDLIRHAVETGIRVGPGRGSAAGSVVAYCLRIVELDPLRYDLLFERFLNPGRTQMPDIDMDFDERYRSEMIRYAGRRYGADHVAQIVTFSTIKARAAVRDAARVLGLPYAVGDRIAKVMPPLVMGRDTPLAACLELKPGYEDGFQAATELREMVETDPEVRMVVEVAKGLEGLRRQDGIHAAAVVITNEPLTTYLPIQRKPDPGQDPSLAPMVTQYEMHGVEELGLLKMDFLGLRTLSVLDRAIELIRESRGVEVVLEQIPLDDEPTYAMLREADTIGVFQLEGTPMRALVRSLAPTRFDDIAALTALYRPGPMAANMHNDYADRKNGRKQITYLHPDLEELLSDTYGLMIYQESVMRVAQKFAGYSLAEADNLRKACGKKIRELIAAEREKFVKGCIDTGYGEQIGTELFNIIEPFADYAFNKSHSYGYGLIAYQTAYLKANYPTQYLAALLTSVKDDKDKTALYLAEASAHAIPVLVPDINHSMADFVVVKDGDQEQILFGLAAIRNVGEGLVSLIVSEREANGPFQDFGDFCLRVDPVVLNKRTIESLIKGGAFDSLGYTRKGLVEIHEGVIDQALDKRRERDRGVFSLFEDPTDVAAGVVTLEINASSDEWPKDVLLKAEREMLGLYVSSHPLAGLDAQLAKIAALKVAEVLELAETGVSQAVTIVGVATTLTKRHTKKGELMGTITLEDLRGAIEVMVFPKTMAEYGQLLTQDTVLKIQGRLDTREERPKIVAGSIEVVELTQPEYVNGAEIATLIMPVELASRSELERLRQVLEAHEGEHPVMLKIGTMRFLVDDLAIPIDNNLIGHLRSSFGDRVAFA
ncbi:MULTISPECIES: DNA polymerase III subunit alpha [Ferrimicrobium]|uniref:DNA polymerase III subunit alpha n=1 Tax=Ferrimicrobium acidiphilum TaxID=121039 RepID=A0ABV3XZF3_9ACTN|nr:DNA polymerase III subunit alpha [Ferrimicrobium sp.]